MKSIDLTGKRFGRLIVIAKTGKRLRGYVVWLCDCVCGKQVRVSYIFLKRGDTNSCGCLRREKMKNVAKNNIKHGHAVRSGSSREYKTWEDMKSRCMNPNNKFYKDYGDRGIKVFEEWLKFENFLAYLKANNMYPKPTGMSIDRIDNDGNYEPGNIKWATPLEQRHNQRVV